MKVPANRLTLSIILLISGRSEHIQAIRSQTSECCLESFVLPDFDLKEFSYLRIARKETEN